MLNKHHWWEEGRKEGRNEWEFLDRMGTVVTSRQMEIADPPPADVQGSHFGRRTQQSQL